MIGNLGVTEILLIGGIVVLLFGAKRIPEVAKGIGQGLRIFKEEMHKGATESPKDEPAKQQ